MGNSASVIITIASYLAGAWVAFKIYDARTKGETRTHDLLLLVLLLVFAGGGGTLLVYLLKSFFGV
ncbi:MAG: hypothetical protein WCA32_00625 [Chromatiaceae bacterium]|jgi:hypothetical protein